MYFHITNHRNSRGIRETSKFRQPKPVEPKSTVVNEEVDSYGPDTADMEDGDLLAKARQVYDQNLVGRMEDLRAHSVPGTSNQPPNQSSRAPESPAAAERQSSVVGTDASTTKRKGRWQDLDTETAPKTPKLTRQRASMPSPAEKRTQRGASNRGRKSQTKISKKK